MKVEIKGEIIPNAYKWIYSAFNIDSFCPKDLKIEDENETLDIEINSFGGSVYAGIEIYNKLKKHKGQVNITVVGVAMSSASVITMAGDNITMGATSQMMIHNVSAYQEGDYRDMNHASDYLKKWNESLANAYVYRTKMDKQEILKMMDKETFLTAQECIELGFADSIIEEEMQLVANYGVHTIPYQIINKMMREKEQEELNLLKLKGEKI